MKWIYSTIPFSFLVLLVAVLLSLTGCASSTPEDEKKELPINDDEEEESPRRETSRSESKPESSTKMTVQYANKSSKISMEIDVNNQDINLEMSGSSAVPPPMNSGFANQPDQPYQPPQDKQGKQKPPEEETEDDWDDVMDIAKNEDFSKGNTQSVLAEIRKAQEFFYQKRYPEALDMAKFSIQKQETPEGYALKGSIEYMMGNTKAAKESWNQSLRLNPDMPAVTQMLRKLKTMEAKKKKAKTQ